MFGNVETDTLEVLIHFKNSYSNIYESKKKLTTNNKKVQ